MLRAQLYADVILNLYYVLMNAYGWYYWQRGGVQRQSASDAIGNQTNQAEQKLNVTLVPTSQWPGLLALGVIGTAAMGWYFASFTNAALPYPDSFTTVASFIAMWMSARKYLESWILWFIIDVVQVVLYVLKGIEAYAVLYLIYLGMAVAGWYAWRNHLNRTKDCGITKSRDLAEPPVKHLR